MKRIFVAVYALLLMLVTACSWEADKSVITLNITDGNLKEKPVLYLPDGKEITMELSEDGTGSATVNNTGNIYVRLGYRYTSRLIWLAPDAQVNVSFHSKKFHENITVEGTDSNINTFLNSNVYKYATIDDCSKGEMEYISFADSLLNANLAFLEKENFSAEFKQQEALRLKYYTYQILPSSI